MKSDEIWIRMMEYGNRIGCHQLPRRSLFIKGYQFPICARCTGVIIGEIIAIILILCKIKINIWTNIIFLTIMGIDWFIQFINILESNNIRRLITGFLGGFGLTYIYYHLIIYVISIITKIVI